MSLPKNRSDCLMYTHKAHLFLNILPGAIVQVLLLFFRDNRDMFSQEDDVVNKCRQFMRVGVAMVTTINKVYATRYCNLHKSRMAVVRGGGGGS